MSDVLRVSSGGWTRVSLCAWLLLISANGPAQTPEAISASANRQLSSIPKLNLTPQAQTLSRAGSFTGDLRDLPSTRPKQTSRPEREPPEIERGVIEGGGDGTAPVRAPGTPVINAPAPAPLSSFIGLDLQNWGSGYPPDTNGDVSPSHFIQSVNSSVGIYRKSDGVRLAAFSLDTFMSQGNFGNVCDTDNAGDPVVLYDTFEDRWIITDFAFQRSGNDVVNPPGMFQCFAASRTSDPISGGWNFYSINTTGGFGDYGKFGIWPDGLYSTFNMFNYVSTAGFQNVRVYALNKAQMYAGEPTVQTVRFDLPPAEFTVLPANARLQSGTPPLGRPNLYSVVWQFTNAISVYKFQVDWNKISSSTFTGPFLSIAPASWISPPGTVPAQGGANNETLPIRLMAQNQYTNLGGVESLWNSHTIRNTSTAGVSAPRFYQVNVTGGTVAGTTTQAFTHEPDNTISRYIPSLAVDRAGNMLMAYSASSASLPPAIRYAGRLAGDAVNSLAQTETALINGTGAQVSFTRWGDYSSVTLDPDGCTFWMTTEYYSAVGNDWQTRIGSTKFPSCTNSGSGTLQGTVTVNPGGAPIAGATVLLGSRSTTTNGSGAYSFTGLPAGTYLTESVSANGYTGSTANNLVITVGGTTTQNFALTAAAPSACFADTTQADFLTGMSSSVDLTASAGNVLLSSPANVDQQNTTVTGSGFTFTTTSWFGQTFTAGVNGTLASADVYLFCSGCTGTTPNITVSLRATSGNLPTGADLATATIPGFSSGSGGYFTANFGTPATLTAGTVYALVLRPVSAPSAGNYAYVVSTGSVYAAGRRVTSTNSGGTWTGQAEDVGFHTYMRTTFSPSGDQTSSLKNANPASGFSPYWTTLSWNATTPANTTLRFQIAASTSSAGPFSYVGPDGTAGTFFTTSGASLSQFDGYNYLRYKAYLATSNTAVSPTLADVTVCHANSVTGTADDLGLQVGSTTLPATIAGGNRITRINFSRPYLSAPVVIVQPSNENPDPVTLRVGNITRSGFDVLQVESPGCTGCTGLGATTAIHWLAATPGSYRLRQDTRSAVRLTEVRGSGPGALVKVGSVTTSATQHNGTANFAAWPSSTWQAVSFPGGETFATTPVVLTGVQSWNNEGPNLNGPALTLNGTSQVWATAVSNNITTGGFDVALESSEVDDDDFLPAGFNNSETIGYIALERSVSMMLTPLGGGSAVGLATGNGTANGTCASAVLTGLSFPVGPPTLANLRGFAGKQSRFDVDGGWLRRCAMTTPGGNAVSMTMRVDEDADFDLERTHTTNENVGAVVFGGDFGTTPITLAKVATQRIGSQLRLEFASATEVGHLGYRIWGRSNESESWRLLTDHLIVSRSGDGMDAQRYETLLDDSTVTEIRIEDVDLLGRSRFHPAVAVGTVIGADPVAQPLDWSGIRAANARVAIRSARAEGSSAVWAAVTQTGVQRVSYEELAAIGFSSQAQVDDIAVLDDARPVLRYVNCAGSSFGPGCTVEWLGTRRDSEYGSANQYTITIDRKLARAVGSGATQATSDSPRIAPWTLQQAPNRGYTFSAPGRDPWFDARLVATTAPVETSRNFALPGLAPGPVQLSVNIWGGLDFSDPAPDHSIELLLNGQRLLVRQFDGLTAETLRVDVPLGLLQASNTLTLRVLGDTGYAADVVLLDGYSVTYPRFTAVASGELQMGQLGSTLMLGNDRLFAAGFETSLGFQLTGIATPSVIWTQFDGLTRRDSLPAGPASIDQRVSAFLVADEAHIRHPALSAASAPIGTTSRVDYLIISHPLFEAELQPIVALQQTRGYSVSVLRTDQIYASWSDGEPNPLAIRQAINTINPRFVLLVGGDTYDYHDYLGLGSQSFVPTFYRVADPVVRFAASDLAYSDADSDGAPDRALGRIPARTVEELRRAIASMVERAALPARSYFAAAGGSGANEHFGLHSRSMLSALRQGQSKSFGLVDEIGLQASRVAAIEALSGSADWISYLGHSGPNRWASQNLLDTSQLATLQRTGAPAIVSQWGCWNNYFVLPSQDTMSHALLLRGNRLAAAVIGSTSLAEDTSHLALATRIFDLVEDGLIEGHTGAPVNTLGEALQQAARDLAQRAPEHLESNYSIELFGDPAMPLR